MDMSMPMLADTGSSVIPSDPVTTPVLTTDSGVTTASISSASITPVSITPVTSTPPPPPPPPPPTEVTTSPSTVQETSASRTPTSVILPTSDTPTTLSPSTTPSSSEIVVITTTIPPTTDSSTTSDSSASTFTTLPPTSSPTANITITPLPANNTSNTGKIVGIAVGAGAGLLLLLLIFGLWYRHNRKRNKVRREIEHELATNSQLESTFTGGYNLNQRDGLIGPEPQQQPTLPDVENYAPAAVLAAAAKPPGLRRSNTREDGRRNGIMLQTTNPDPPIGAGHSESQLRAFTAGDQNRDRFDAWKRAKGINHHSLDAAALYHHHEFLESSARRSNDGAPISPVSPVSPIDEQQELHDTNVEILSQGLKRVRSRLDAWKTGEVPPVLPEMEFTPASPVEEYTKVSKHKGAGQGLKPFLLGAERPVSQGPATFEEMGLREGKKGLSIDKERTPRSVLDK